MPLHLPAVGGASLADITSGVWAYDPRRVTNLADVRAALIDNIDALLSTRLSSTDFDTRLSAVRAAYIDLLADAKVGLAALEAVASAIPTTPELEADAAKRYAALGLLIGAIPTTPELEAAALARYNTLSGLVDEIEPIIKVYEFETGFPSPSETDAIADASGGVDTTELRITPSIPSGATRIRVELIAIVTVLNNSATALKIDIDVKGQKGAGAFQTFFTEDSVVGFGNTDGATVDKAITQDVTTLVDTIDGSTTYDWKLTIKTSAVGAIRVTTMYSMIVTWRKA